MANIQSSSQNFFFLGQHCQLNVIFRDIQSNAPVNVEKPELEIRNSSKEIVDLTILCPFTPTKAKTGEYYTTFLSDNLIAGDYDITCSGYYPDNSEEKNKLEITAKFTVYEMPVIQTYIVMLRNILSDDIPELYWIDDPEQYRWTDGDLYIALDRAVQFFNEYPPIVSNQFYTVENMPYWDIMLLMAEYYSLNKKEILELFNTFQYSDDTSFSIDRSGKIHSKSQQILETVNKKVPEMKADMIFRQATTLGIKSTRLPLRTLRSMSMSSPYMSFLSGGGY